MLRFYICRELDPTSIQVAQFDTRLTQSLVGIALRSQTSSELHVVRLEPEDGDRVVARHQYAIPNVVSIAPVQSTRSGSGEDGIKDLLCLRDDGSLFLVCPGGTIDVVLRHEASSKNVHLSIPHEPSSLYGAMGASGRPFKLGDAVRSAVTLQYCDGPSVRLSTDLTPQHELVHKCFQTLSHVCSAPQLLVIRKEYLRNWSKIGSCGTKTEEFACFADAVMRNLARSPRSEGPRFAAEDSIQNENSDAWAILVSHPLWSQLPDDPALLYLHFPSACPSTVSESKLDPFSYNESGAILHGLHLFGEEMKLDNYKRSDLDILAPLLVDMAHIVGADWADYWLRMVPDASDSWDLSPSSECLIVCANSLHG